MWKKIALLMDREGIKSISKLADKAGVPASTIYTWKQEYELAQTQEGKQPISPTVDNLQKVAKALNVEITELL